MDTNTQGQAAATLNDMPTAIGERGRIVAMESQKGKYVVVRKWTLTKSQMIMKWIADLFEKASDSDKATIESGNTTKIAMMAMSTWGDRVINFLKLCVREQDEDLISGELDLEDALSILVATIEVNFSEGLKKNVKSLLAVFPQKSTEGKASTP